MDKWLNLYTFFAFVLGALLSGTLMGLVGSLRGQAKSAL